MPYTKAAGQKFIVLVGSPYLAEMRDRLSLILGFYFITYLAKVSAVSIKTPWYKSGPPPFEIFFIRGGSLKSPRGWLHLTRKSGSF